MHEITIIIVDDHPLFRQGVIDALSLEPGFKIIGEAIDGAQGLKLVRQLMPIIAIVDVNLPEVNGHQVTRQIVEERISTRVILLTAYDDPEQRMHAMRVGAAAYCSKDVEPETLVKVIHHVVAGKFVVNDDVLDARGLDRWLQEESTGGRYVSDPSETYQPLSNREMEVLIYVTRGMSNKEIAISLGISHQTVKNHVTAILRKLGVDDRTQAAIYALRRGWVRLHEQGNQVDTQE